MLTNLCNQKNFIRKTKNIPNFFTIPSLIINPNSPFQLIIRQNQSSKSSKSKNQNPERDLPRNLFESSQLNQMILRCHETFEVKRKIIKKLEPKSKYVRSESAIAIDRSKERGSNTRLDGVASTDSRTEREVTVREAWVYVYLIVHKRTLDEEDRMFPVGETERGVGVGTAGRAETGNR